MATISDTRAIHATLTTTTVDEALLTQFHDAVQVINRDGTNNLWVSFDGTTPVAEAEGIFIVPPSSARQFTLATANFASGVPGSTTPATACHRVRVLGNGGSYDVEGV